MVSQTFPEKRCLAQSRTKQLYPVPTRIGGPIVILCLNLNGKQQHENGVLPFFNLQRFMCLLTCLDFIAYVKMFER